MQSPSSEQPHSIIIPSESITPSKYPHLSEQQQAKIQVLHQWMIKKGCLIHPSVQIPSFINGYQGVGTKCTIPPKTVVIGIPSSLILTVTKCYKDPELKSIFTKNDDLFDYEASDDCEFNVLCVFLMYQKLNIEKSPWKIYLETIGQPETAIDWPNHMLKGLNKSAIEQILHIRIQCQKLRDQLSSYLKTTKQFSAFPLQEIKQCFNYCYRAVMTRCFGYYFGQASLIPVADLINHGCEVVDHQLINVRYEKGMDDCEGYKEKSDRLDCELLGIKRGKNVMVPFRERFLLTNGLVQCDIEEFAKLDRKKIDSIISKHNQTLFTTQPHIDITQLQFCQQDDSEDNDTDVDQQNQRQLQLERMHLQQLQQIQNFKKYHHSVKVETYKEVHERFEKYEQQLGSKSEINQDIEQAQSPERSRNDLFIQGVIEGNVQEGERKTNQQNAESQQYEENEEDWEDEDETQPNQLNQLKSRQKTQSTKPSTIPSTQKSSDPLSELFFEQKSPVSLSTSLTNSLTSNLPTIQQSHSQPHNTHCSKQTPTSTLTSTPLPFPKSIVPIQMIESSSSSQSQDDQEWGLEPDSYFTLSTSSAVGPNKQLYNSYGSRTNKFLLIWYGFCYRNNLFDSVSLRLHVQFHKELPEAKSIVLDTYIGGQGLTFRKNESEIVKGNEVSREFRLKINKLCIKLLTFLRLYLLDYYKGPDLYKICVTLPSSLQFQTFVLSYYKQILLSLYDRYPLQIINELNSELTSPQFSQQDKQHIRFKLIYLEEQRKILDENMDTVQCVMKVWQKIREKKEEKKEFDRSFYQDFTIYQLRKLKPYLTALKNNYSYVLYEQGQTELKQTPNLKQSSS